MHPAFSVIFFTVVSGCGYGLLFLLGLLLATDAAPFDAALVLSLLVNGALFAIAGLVSSLFHLGQPQRAWRALSQWRSSWLSREGVAALVSFVPMLAIAYALLHEPRNAALLRAAGLALALASLATVYCTARIYSSLKTIPAWHNGYVVPGYLLAAALGGSAWLAFIYAIRRPEFGLLLAQLLHAELLFVLAAATAALKMAYWRFIDRHNMITDAGTATGLARFGQVTPAEAPHTEANYLTQEMGFALARKHAQRLRLIALVLLAGMPALLGPLCFGAMLTGMPMLAMVCTAVLAAAITAGLFVERWLFFAEARHVVMAYYDRRIS